LEYLCILLQHWIHNVATIDYGKYSVNEKIYGQASARKKQAAKIGLWINTEREIRRISRQKCRATLLNY